MLAISRNMGKPTSGTPTKRVPRRVSASDLGRVKTPCLAEYKCVGVLWGGEAQSFFGFDYALIAAMSGRTPMMFMTRVRL